VTDEDRDSINSKLSYLKILLKLHRNNALLNAVVDAKFSCADGRSAMGMNADGFGFVVDGIDGFEYCDYARVKRGANSTIWELFI
jgi:hypothetical protein